MFGFFRKRFRGVAILETAITLPIVLYVVFFSIELIRIGLAQNAVDTITKECTFQLMATGKVDKDKFDGIFKKYKPLGIPLGNFRYYIRIYSDITDMMSKPPYGGETIGWADTGQNNDSPTSKAIANKYGLTNSHILLNKYQTSICNGSEFGEYGNNRKTLLESDDGVPSGYIFVLTVAVKFPFSSPFIAKLFSGGSNTNKRNVYILWARGSGMVN
ncbi:MAG: pilus assembly protein [Alphaproteobacteria bacterium]|nr:pilus assembly protein [Alphaproteobacteria bacterium]MBO7537516.1 pilus assembly protein [Alphaproteobacteria bacterium]